MSTRPAMDWSPLEHTSDPIPGDPGDVRITGIIFSKTADAVESAAGHLRRLESGDEQCSEAISKIQQRAGEAAAELDKVKTRYAGAANALMEYAEVLGQSQATSLEALQAAGPASTQRRQANSDLAKVKLRADNSLDPQEKQELIQQILVLKARRDGAKSDVESAKARLARAIEDRDRAAERAKSDIDQAMSTSQLNDSTWDRVKKFLQETVTTVLDVISVACTVVALVLMATGVGAPIAGVLMIVAGITGGIAGLLKAWKKFDEGDAVGGWIEVGFAVVSLFGAAKLLRVARLKGLTGLGAYVTKDAAEGGRKIQKSLGKYFPAAKNHAFSRTAQAEQVLGRATLRVKTLAGKPGAAGSRRIARLAHQHLFKVMTKERVQLHVAKELADVFAEQLPFLPDKKEMIKYGVTHWPAPSPIYRPRVFFQPAPQEIVA